MSKPKPSLAAVAKQPVVQPPVALVAAAFTPRELDLIRTVCRDSESEQALRILNGAVARGAAK